MSVSYFDQNFVNWFMLLAFIATLCGGSLSLRRPEFLAKLDAQTEGNSGAAIGMPVLSRAGLPQAAIVRAKHKVRLGN
jgi:hypothetical protein